MSKSSLIIDIPEHCYLCSCYAEYEDVGYCQGITAKRVPTEGKPSWCPLKPYKKVDAIPIEWILNYRFNNRGEITYYSIDAIDHMLSEWCEESNIDMWDMIDRWEKENETE